MPASAEAQAATLEKFVSGWRKWTPEDFLASWSDDCTQTSLPYGHPPHPRTQLEQFFPQLMSALTNFELTIHNTIHDPANSKAALYATTKADSVVGPYNNEQSIFIWFNETGEINKIEEMFDSAFMKDWIPKYQQYFAQKEQAQDHGT